MMNEKIKNYVLDQIKQSKINKYPFFNLYIENIFPENFYERLKSRMLDYKYNSVLQDRNWDNPSFINKKFSLKEINDCEIETVTYIFNDYEIKKAFIEKFYVKSDFIEEIVFTHDLQFVFTVKNKFQVIHTDIPAQFLSIVFYLPEKEIISDEEEMNNGTILYDKDLNANKISKFKKNSVACFAAHFYSYHGFNTTIDNRNTMLFFYAQKDLIKRFYDNIHNENNEQNVSEFKDVIQWKISKYKLREYDDNGNDLEFLSKLIKEKSICKINSLNGRISYKEK